MSAVSVAAVDFIKRWEGFRSKKYLCAGNYWTIGFGSVLRNGAGKMLTGNDAEPDVKPWTKQYAVKMLRERDLPHYWRETGRLCNPDGRLNNNQLSALTSFAYNLGVGALRASTLRRKVLAGEDHEVPRQLMRWVNAGGRRVRGLVRRRADEARLYAAVN